MTQNYNEKEWVLTRLGLAQLMSAPPLRADLTPAKFPLLAASNSSWFLDYEEINELGYYFHHIYRKRYQEQMGEITTTGIKFFDSDWNGEIHYCIG